MRRTRTCSAVFSLINVNHFFLCLPLSLAKIEGEYFFAFFIDHAYECDKNRSESRVDIEREKRREQ
jgi:hypothetical protein